MAVPDEGPSAQSLRGSAQNTVCPGALACPVQSETRSLQGPRWIGTPCGCLVHAQHACVLRCGMCWPGGAVRPVSGSAASVDRRSVRLCRSRSAACAAGGNVAHAEGCRLWQGRAELAREPMAGGLYGCSAQAQRTYALRRGVCWPRGAVCTASYDVARVAGSSWCGIAWLCLMSGLQRRTCAARRKYRVPWRGSMPCAVGDAQPAGPAAGRHAYRGPPRAVARAGSLSDL
eukprot:scaffold20740_cov89-Phaeocystis_antarctica.AAC.3